MGFVETPRIGGGVCRNAYSLYRRGLVVFVGSFPVFPIVWLRPQTINLFISIGYKRF